MNPDDLLAAFRYSDARVKVLNGEVSESLLAEMQQLTKEMSK